MIQGPNETTIRDLSGQKKALTVTSPMPDFVLCGQRNVAVTSTARAIASGFVENGVVITAKSTNSGYIFVGGGGVTTTDDGNGNGYRLDPGQSISFATGQLDNIFINGTAGDGVYFAGN